MGYFSLPSLRARLLLLVLLCAIPALGLALFVGIQQRRDDIATAQDSALRLARLAVSHQEAVIEGAHQLLLTLAADVEVHHKDPHGCPPLLPKLLRRHPQYVNFAVADTKGQIVCSALPLTKPVNVADRPWFHRALHTRAFAVGEYQIGRITGKPNLGFGYPVIDRAGQVQSVVLAAIDLITISRFAAKLQLPTATVLLVVDRRGTVVARHPDIEGVTSKSFPEEPSIRTILTQHEGTAEVVGLDGTMRVWGFAAIRSGREPAVHIAVSFPKAIVLAKANRTLAGHLALLGLVTILALGAAWAGGNAFILRKVGALVRVTRRLAAGDLSARTRVPSGQDELSELARSFDDMASALEQHEAERRQTEAALRRVNRALKALSECNRALTQATDESALLSDICRIIVDTGGYRLAWVGIVEHNERKRVRPVAQWGYEEGYLDTINVSWADTEQGRGPTGTAIRSGHSVICRDIRADPTFLPWQAEATKRGYGSSIAIPLQGNGQSLGALTVYAEEADAFGPEEVERLNELARDLEYGIMALRTRAERQRAEADLRAASAYNRNLIEASLDPLVTIGPDGTITDVNAATEAATGYARAELVGRDFSTYFTEPEAARAGYERVFQEGLVRDYPLELRHRDGHTTPVLYNAAVYRDADGQALGVFAAARDITERWRAEEEMRETNRRLEEALTELRRVQGSLIEQERLRALGQMASGIAHDFNNALNPIVGFSELLLQHPEHLQNREKVLHYVEIIHTAGRDATNVVSRLREFYRKREAGEILQPINLNKVVQEAITLTQPKWKDQMQALGRTVTVATALHDIPPILGVEAELREALTNLIFNAIDAMPKGGTITIRTRVEAHTGDGESPGSAVVLEVTDTGTGMTEEVRRRCLEPFFTTKGTLGTGLGLSVVHGTIRRHEGTMHIESTAGKGTTFLLRFPVQPRQGAAAGALDARVSPRTLHVLVVDDDPLALELVTAFLAEDGHTVETAINGREALGLFVTRQFDLVLTDWAMPEMGGDQLAAAIKQTQPGIPVIMLTGFGGLMREAADMPLKVDAVVSKPVTITALREAIATVMGCHGSHQA